MLRFPQSGHKTQKWGALSWICSGNSSYTSALLNGFPFLLSEFAQQLMLIGESGWFGSCYDVFMRRLGIVLLWLNEIPSGNVALYELAWQFNRRKHLKCKCWRWSREQLLFHCILNWHLTVPKNISSFPLFLSNFEQRRFFNCFVVNCQASRQC